MSIFPTKILVATDGSEEAQMAATTAINLAKNTHSELHVLTVGAGSPSYDVRIPEVADELRRHAQEMPSLLRTGSTGTTGEGEATLSLCS